MPSPRPATYGRTGRATTAGCRSSSARKTSTPADQGDASGQARLGTLYCFGIGVPQNYNEAFRYFKLAADQSDSFGQHGLGLMYYEGNGVTQDYKEALKYFKLSADQGDVDGQSKLGEMYFKGYGVAKKKTILASEYKLYLPSEEQLAKQVIEIKKVLLQQDKK